MKSFVTHTLVLADRFLLGSAVLSLPVPTIEHCLAEQFESSCHLLVASGRCESSAGKRLGARAVRISDVRKYPVKHRAARVGYITADLCLEHGRVGPIR